VLAWLAEQDDLVEAFANKEDVYRKMAAAIYGVAEDQITKDQRFIGKTTILGAGYGMGAVKFQAQLKTFGVDMELDEARRIIDIYRRTNDNITRLWRQAQNVLVNLSRGDPAPLGRAGVLEVVPAETAIRLPSGLLMRYDDLKISEGEKGIEFHYQTRKGRTRIYGGKVIENVCQAIARCIIAEQMLRIHKRYKVVLTVHDAIAVCVRDVDVEDARAYVEESMRWVPDWAKGLPVNCESGVGKSYGDC
jgi:DNA polymerase